MSRLNQRSLQISLAKAQKAMSQGKNKLAASLFRKLLTHSPDNPDITLGASQALLLIGERNESRQALSLARQSHHLNYVQHLILGTGYFRCGDIEEAYTYHKNAWQITGNDLQAVMLAETAERLELIDEGLEVIDQIKQPIARSEMVRGLLLNRQGDTEQALSSFLNAYRLSQKMNDYLTGLQSGLEAARCHDRLGDHQAAWQQMQESRQIHFPEKDEVARYDKEFETITNRGLSDLEAYFTHQDSMPSGAEGAPLLVTGHPRSGTSVITVNLARELHLNLYDEPDAFHAALDHHGKVRNPPPQLVKASAIDTFHRDYRRRLSEIKCGTDPYAPLIDKNPVLEHQLARWMTVFPDGQIILVQRHPIDILISAMFVYLPPNAHSMQYFTVERAIESIRHSLKIQNLCQENAPDRFRTIQYEDYVRTGNLTLTGLPRSSSGQGHDDSTLYSPNYALAQKPVYQDACYRFENYTEFLPTDLLENLERS